MSKRRNQLYAFQAHALSDALGACRGHLPRPDRFDAEWRSIPCPLCMGWRRPASLTEDHAPQKAGQSALGSAHVVVLTCKADNERAGKTFEREAAWYAHALDAVPDPLCPVHQRDRRTRGGLIVPVAEDPLTLTDARTAFLIAFATLGIRWAATRRLDRLRQAFRDGDLDRAVGDLDLICRCGVSALKSHCVYEVVAPVPAVLVVGAHAGVVLPCHRSPDHIAAVLTSTLRVDRSGPAVVTSRKLHFRHGRVYPWPHQFVDPGGSPAKAWDDLHEGNFFHFDRCPKDDHHLLHAVPRSELPALLIPSDRSTRRRESAARIVA